MQRQCSPQQAHTINKARQAEIMVAMHMADKYMLCLPPLEAKTLHLNLRTFTTVQQYIVAIYRHNLCSRMAPESRQRRVIAEYRDLHYDSSLNKSRSSISMLMMST